MEQEKYKIEYEDILAKRENEYYGIYYLKLDIKEHIAQLRAQKANKKKRAQFLKKLNLISLMHQLCSLLHSDYLETLKKEKERMLKSGETFMEEDRYFNFLPDQDVFLSEDKYYYFLSIKYALSREILKKLKELFIDDEYERFEYELIKSLYSNYKEYDLEECDYE